MVPLLIIFTLKSERVNEKKTKTISVVVPLFTSKAKRCMRKNRGATVHIKKCRSKKIHCGGSTVHIEGKKVFALMHELKKILQEHMYTECTKTTFTQQT